MIQLKRGKTDTWRKLKTPLAAGQPGYDKDKHKLKIGDGKTLWEKLPYAGGISDEEVLDSEKNAKERQRLDPENGTIITYGPTSPDRKTVGKLYLQHYETDPEADYVVAAGVDSGWTYQKWKSGIASCSKVFEVTTSVQTAIGSSGLYQNSSDIKKVAYPFTFVSKDGVPRPSETVSIQSPGGLVWIAAAKGVNTSTHSATYSIISADKLTNSATYKISIKVDGFWR
jgi:hypothetical protein